MSKRYPGNFITGNPVALTQSSNAGVWDLKDQYQATSNDTWQEADGIYEIPRSLRIRSSASAYLSRVPATSSNRTCWTWSAWTKSSYTFTQLFGVTSGVGTGNTQEDNRLAIQLSTDGAFQFYEITGGSTFAARKYSAAKFRDPSAWYHLIVAVDYTQSVGDYRIKMYVNGVQLSSFSDINTPTQNYSSFMNGSGNNHTIGAQIKRYDNFYDGHLTEMNFIDGQQLDPSYFGYFDPITNIWQPKRYTGTYGTNGFYLPFNENQSVTNLGRNFAGSNYQRYSEDGTQSMYNLDGGTITIGQTIAPDGSNTGNKLLSDTATGNHRFYTYQGNSNSALPSGTIQCVSAYVKALPSSPYSVISFANWTGSSGGSAYFNLSTGQPLYNISWPTGSGFQYVGNGWYRIWTTGGNVTSNGSGAAGVSIAIADASNNVSHTGNASAGFYFWGVQVNVGLTPDPYIKTTSAIIANDWTTNNISLTAGVTYDSMVDSPTNVFTTATDVGGVVAGNYPTFNILDENTSGLGTPITNGGLTASGTTYAVSVYSATFLVPQSGKWYYETVYSSLTSAAIIGIRSYKTGSTDIQYYSNGTKGVGGTNTSYGATWTTGDVIGVAVDRDAGTVNFYKNNAAQGALSIPTNSAEFNMAWNSISPYGTASCSVNFGQRPFAYAPPAGFKSLNTTNLQALGTSITGNAAIQANKWMDISLYGGTGAARNIQNSGFQPDFIWIKNRTSGSFWHQLYDSARGSLRAVFSNDTSAQSTYTDTLTAFTSTGFNLGTDATFNGGVNKSGDAYVAWQWKQSPTSGFNVVPYTGTGSVRSISHNLGVAPKFMLVKQTGSTTNWAVYHASLPSGFGVAGTQVLNLNGQGANTQNFDVWESNNPSSSGFSVGASTLTNANGGTYIAYLWAEVPGFSKFGSFSGNGSTDGPFINTGFRPKFFLYKAHTHSSDWWLLDATRSLNNVAGNYVFPNAASAEGVESTWIDFLSNGIKIRGRTDPNTNGSDRSYIYAAFAESPFALNNRAR